MSNPYKTRPDFCFWSRAMTWPAAGHIDPVAPVDANNNMNMIRSTDRVATMGSCFAQHLSKYIRHSGLNYYVAETALNLSEEEARRHNYEVFSARYGNVYSTRQAVQLFDRAFGFFSAADDIWRKDEGYVDAFRPQIEPQPFATPEEVVQSRIAHLGYVRDVFTKCDWLVFTLGLTEIWRSKVDGAVYPLAPGVAGGSFDEAAYEFVNLKASEVTEDLENLTTRIKSVNPRAKILLTVSPVPLIATYEPRHVLVSTIYSKSALRVAADEVERKFDNVVYFPSYEIITSPAANGSYYEDDLRQVTDLGVNHVMRVFSEHFLKKWKTSSTLRGGHKS